MPSPKRTQENWRLRVVNLPRYPKRLLLIVNDFLLLTLSLWAGFSLRLNELYVPPDLPFSLVLLAGPIIGLATFQSLGLYRLVTRFIGPQGATRIFLAVALGVLIWVLFVQLSGVKGLLPRSTIVMYGVLAAGLVWSSRQIAGVILRGVPNATPARFDQERKNVIIYGAGVTGVQLVQALRLSHDYLPIGFIDENQNLWGQMVGGLKVYRPQKIAKLIQREGAQEVLLAVPEATRAHRRTIIKQLEPYPVRVRTLPAIADIATGKVRISDLREISADDLLGRDPVPPDPELIERTIRDKAVLVTGAGGSIGSELARQILKQRPARLVLLDVSEAALYQIDAEIRTSQLQALAAIASEEAAPPPVEVVSVLGSVLDDSLIRRTIRQHRVCTIFHAAAYKHVPIVEHNPITGIRNNTYGTRAITEAAREQGVERVVLVSTDKAVRPTNIMGASKRLAEQILQAHAGETSCRTIFTMVRFGNVLDSSGSVVKLFRRQIEDGGPVTVTHPEMIRYFMSIPEAAELVIQAGAMAKGGEVFVLDMGEPVKIDTLARSMIRLMGLEVRDEQNPNGDIAIEYTGLRHGEKLYEELLISENTTGTLHPRIKRSWEPTMTLQEVERELESLNRAMGLEDVQAIHAVLKRTVEGYTPETRHLATAEGEAPQSGRRLLH
ncbi:MAG: nucleoside-diphosphate sugar epimerase/dehydratase [Hyphomicrobiaceae bacterium]